MKLYHTSGLPDILGGHLVPTSYINGPKYEDMAGIWFYDLLEHAKLFTVDGFCATIYETDSDSIDGLGPASRKNQWVTRTPVPSSVLKKIYERGGPELPGLRRYIEKKIKQYNLGT